MENEQRRAAEVEARYSGSTFEATPEQLSAWTDEANLRDKKRIEAHGFSIAQRIDGGDPRETGRQVDLVVVSKGEYPKHRHNESDARFFGVGGQAKVLLDTGEKLFGVGDTIRAPRGSWHGFVVEDEFRFVTIQSPPIQDPETGESDTEFETE